MSSSALSVVICTHNPDARRLSLVLAALESQSLAREGWDLLVVDNASSPALATRLDLSLFPSARLVSQPVPGLTHARLRGIECNRAPLIVWVDDDNVLADDYLSTALNIAARHPLLGAWGGQLIPRFEAPPPAWSRPYHALLALRTLDQDRWSNLPDLRWCPWGAGMVVRREVAETYGRRVVADACRASFDRSPNSLGGSGDLDLALTSLDLGLGHGLFRDLKLEHLVPPQRLRETYLLRISEDGARTDELLRLARGFTSPAPAASARDRFRAWLSLPLAPRARRFAIARVRGRQRAHREWLARPVFPA